MPRASADAAVARPPRVGPAPAPPPERLDSWIVMDLLATTRRWRVHEPFVCGQADGLSRAMVACLNAGQPVPRWLRETLVAFLLEALWEQSPPGGRPTAAAARAWDEQVDALVRRWREPPRGQGTLP